MAKREKSESSGGGGTNVPDGAKILDFVEKVENLHGDLGKLKSEFMLEAKNVHADIKEVYKDAKTAGFNKKALKGLVKKRALEADIEEIQSDLEGDDNDAYTAYLLALEKVAA